MAVAILLKKESKNKKCTDLINADCVGYTSSPATRELPARREAAPLLSALPTFSPAIGGNRPRGEACFYPTSDRDCRAGACSRRFGRSRTPAPTPRHDPFFTPKNVKNRHKNQLFSPDFSVLGMHDFSLPQYLVVKRGKKRKSVDISGFSPLFSFSQKNRMKNEKQSKTA